jgi:hypothetical protein
MNNTVPSNESTAIFRSSMLLHILTLFFVLIFSILLYAFIHESGHAIPGLLFGGKITSFSAGVNAHVGMDGSFTPIQQAVFTLGGPLLPFLAAIIFLLSAPRRGNALLEWVKVFVATISITSLLGWVALPWFYLAGVRPSDDSITFIMNTGIAPPLVSAGAASIFAGGLTVFLRQVEGVKGILSRLQAKPTEVLAPGTRRTLATLVVIFVLVAGTSLGLGAVFGTSNTDFLDAPSDYTLVTEIQLDERALSDETVYTFTLEQPASVSLFFSLSGVTRGPGKISLTGPGGYNNIIFTADEKLSGNLTVNPRDLMLESGQYQIILTFPQDPGVLVISQKMNVP